MYKAINYFILLFLMQFPFLIFSQNQTNEILNKSAIDFESNYSYILAHHSKMIHLTTSHFFFYELSYSRNTNGRKYWHQLYNYPTYGFTSQYNNLGNSKILGSSFALYPYLSLPLIKKDNFQFSFKIGGGLAYLTKKFDKDINYKNVAISTNLNIAINLGFEFEQKINSLFSIYEGLNITHFSNGALRMPNTGINLPSLSVALRYYRMNNSSINNSNSEMPKVEKKYFFSLMGACGLKELYPSYGKKYPAFTLCSGLNLQPSIKRIFNLNFDLFYNLSNFETLKRKNIETNKISIARLGLSLGHEFIFGKTNFVILIGRYLYAKDYSDGYIYNRFGFKRKINKNIFFNLSLKSHLFVADYIEWGLGYNF